MSSIPGPKPPPPAPKIEPPVSAPLQPTLPLPKEVEVQAKVSSNPVDQILNKPTADVIHEAALVTAHAVDQSKTVGGLGITLLTLGVFIATSPWSWIAALLLGPAPVWVFVQETIVEGAKTALVLVLLVLAFFGALVALLVGLYFFRQFA